MKKKLSRDQAAAAQNRAARENLSETGQTGEMDEDGCRCEEMSKKSLSELLKVAVSDLSFWKKRLK